jgi:hypothetical protein
VLPVSADELKPYQYTRLTGASGEFYVAAELTRRLWLASVTPEGVERTDVLAQHLETRAIIAIQVKTSRGTNFQLNAKLETPTKASNEWIIFVALGQEGERPTFYLMPRNLVAGLIWVDHRRWLGKPGKDGRPHKDTDRRNIRDWYIEAYRERWDLLQKPTGRVAPHLPDWWWDEKQHHGLPEGHPGVGRRPAAAKR